MSLENEISKVLQDTYNMSDEIQKDTRNLKFRLRLNKVLMAILDYSYEPGIELTEVRTYIDKIIQH